MSYEWPGSPSDISREEFFEKYSEHSGWLQGSGTRLYLAHKNLSGLGLIGGLWLPNADFAYADLSGIEFNDCNLRSCNFMGANLTNASFINCDLSYCFFSKANLSSINITNSTLYKAVGNGKEIKNFHIDDLFLTYTSHVLQLDCIKKSLEWWRTATVEQLTALAEDPILGQQLDVDWSGFMAPATIHDRIAKMYQLIDSAPAISSTENG